jgi:hypothetical protein
MQVSQSHGDVQQRQAHVLERQRAGSEKNAVAMRIRAKLGFPSDNHPILYDDWYWDVTCILLAFYAGKLPVQRETGGRPGSARRGRRRGDTDKAGGYRRGRVP